MEVSLSLILLLFGLFIGLLLLGVRVAWALGGSAFIVTAVSAVSNWIYGPYYDLDFGSFRLATERLYGLMENELLVALPMFILMGHFLDSSGVAERLVTAAQRVIGRVGGGLALAVVLIGVLLAASTGIIGASVVLLGMLTVPPMLKGGYKPELALGVVCASGTLGILLPPSIMLILMADRLQLPVKDLFLGAMLPGLLLAGLYFAYILIYAWISPSSAPPATNKDPVRADELVDLGIAIIPPVALFVVVLGSIFFGVASPTEASGLGAFGAIILAATNRQLNRETVSRVLEQTLKTVGFLFGIFFGAICFSLVLRLLGGDILIAESLLGLDVGQTGLVVLILVAIFLLGFFLDWIEITLIVLPVVSTVIAQADFPWEATAGIEKAPLIWFAILTAVALQTSFLTPPVGFALFFLKGVCPPEIKTSQIYRGVIPFVLLQLLVLLLLVLFPGIITWLPSIAY